MQFPIQNNTMKTYCSHLQLLLLAVVIITIISCKKDDNNADNNNNNNSNTLTFNPNLTYGSMSDFDGQVYKTIQIGNQVWMAQNLNVAHYRNGDPVSEFTDAATWEGLTAGGYSYYNNDTASAEVYGKLYNFYAVYDPRELAPAGWHIPTIQELEELINYCGGYWDTTAQALRETGTAHWSNMPLPGTNRTGFTGVGSGMRSWDGSFTGIRYTGDYWSSTDASDYYDMDAFTVNIDGNIGWFGGADKRNGMAVRCVKD